MLKKISLLIIIVIFWGCDGPNSPEESKYRYVYYSVNSLVDDAENGLYRYSMTEDKTELITQKEITSISCVSQPGIVVFQEGIDDVKHWGRCEDGSIIEVPFPNDDAYGRYEYSVPPRLALAYSGHHAVYFTDYFPNDSGEQSQFPRLVIFNCSLWQMKIVDSIRYKVLDEFGWEDINIITPGIPNIAVSVDGSEVYFVLNITQKNQYAERNYCGLYKYKDGDIITLIEPGENDLIRIKAFSESYGLLLIKHNQDMRFIDITDNKQSGEPAPFVEENLSNPHQVAIEANMAAVWKSDGIDIIDFFSGETIQKAVDYADIKNEYGENKYLFQRGSLLSISPDGKFVVFGLALDLISIEIGYDLFVANTETGEIRKIAGPARYENVLISNKLDN